MGRYKEISEAYANLHIYAQTLVDRGTDVGGVVYRVTGKTRIISEGDHSIGYWPSFTRNKLLGNLINLKNLIWQFRNSALFTKEITYSRLEFSSRLEIYYEVLTGRVFVFDLNRFGLVLEVPLESNLFKALNQCLEKLIQSLLSE